MGKALLIVNPVSGKMKAKNILYDTLYALDEKGYETTVKFTHRKGHATEFAESDAKDYDLVVCCGGDGTVNEVVGGIMNSGTETTIGYIPTGTTNDFATTLGLTDKPVDAINNIIERPVLSLDIGNFNNERYFSYVASFGLFTSVSYSVSQTLKNTLGYMAYALEGIKNITNIKSYHMTMDADGEIYENDYIFGAVANSTSVGKIMHLKSEHVDLNDGLFEVLLIHYPRSVLELQKIIFSLTNSKFDNEMFDFVHASKIHLKFDEIVDWSLDGEYQKGTHDVTIENIADAVNFAGRNHR